FDFESATGGSGDDITETKDDITLTLTGSPTLGIGTGGSFGSTGQIVRTLGDTSSLTFTFSEAVDVNSILPFNIFGQTIDYTFTPTGGSNS
ncbi:hypothetical protein Q4Q35_12475, partial [Flavivirga aquimarina]